MPDPAANPHRVGRARWQVRHLERIDSTNRYVLDEARAGAAAALRLRAASFTASMISG